MYYGPAPGNYTNRLDAGTALTLTTPVLPGGTYYFTATSHDANGTESDFANIVSTNIATTISGTAPVVTTQPSSVTAYSGASATFSLMVSGTMPLSYQWRLNGTDISGATDSTFTIASVQSSNAGTYACYVTNAFGSVTSADSTLSVLSGTAPVIVTQPHDVASPTGGNVSFSVVASGTSLFYQWFRNGAALTDDGNVIGATTATLNLPSVTSADANNYRVTVSNPWGSVTSIYVVLNVTNIATIVAPSIVTQPTSVTADAGASATFSVAASGSSPLSYQWLFNGTALTGATASSYTITAVQTNNAGTYSCSVSNSAGSVSSAGAMLTVNVPVTPPSIVSQPVSVIANAGSSATFSITTTGSTPLSFQWLFNSVAIPGATASSYTVSSVQSGNVGTYSCIVSNSAGSVTSVDSALALGTYIVSGPTNQTVNATSNFSLTVTVGGTTNNTYQWSKNGSLISNATNSVYSVTNALRADSGSYTVDVTGNVTVTSSPAVITVIDPVFYLQPVSKALVVGQSYTFTAAANGTQPLRYQWYVVKSGSIGLLVNETNTSLTLTSVTANDGGVYYCVADNGNYVQSSNAVLSVYAMAGTYNGLFANTTNVLNASSGSLLNFVVTTNGTYSGKIDIAGTSYSLGGKFDAAASSSNLVTRSKGNVVVQLWSDSPVGTISGNISCAAEGWSVPLRAQVTRYSSSNPTRASGNNVNFVDLNNVIGGQAFVTNTVAGVVKMSGKLADSTKISVSASLTSTDEFPVHVDLYKHTGMLHGWIRLTNGIPAGTLTWIKPGVPSATLNVVDQP